MPAYNAQVPPIALMFNYPLNQCFVFKAEALTLNEFSQQVNVARHPQGYQRGLTVEIDFSANPGNVEIDVVESDDDLLGTLGYQQVPAGGAMTQASLVSGPNGASTRLATDLIPFARQFAALFVKVAPSNGGITATARLTSS